jgi:hypothetical protein
MVALCAQDSQTVITVAQFLGREALPAEALLSLLSCDRSDPAAACCAGPTIAGGEKREGIGSVADAGRGPMHAPSRRTMYSQWRKRPVTWTSFIIICTAGPKFIDINIDVNGMRRCIPGFIIICTAWSNDQAIKPFRSSDLTLRWRKKVNLILHHHLHSRATCRALA